MTSERETALDQIVALAERHGIAADEIASRLATHPTPSRQGGIVKTLLGYTGGIFVFAGLVLLVSMIWPDIGAVQRVIVSLGPGLAAFALGFLSHRDARLTKAVTPFFLLAAFMQPTGIFVFLDEFVPKTGDPELAALLVFGVLTAQQGMAFVHLRRAVLLFLTLIFWTAFLGTTLGWLDADTDLIAVTVGLSLMLLSHGATRRGHHAITPFWYFVAGGFLLGGTFAMVEGGPLEVVYLGVNGFLVYLSIRLASRSLLVVGVVGLIAYLGYFTDEYFANVIGWPVALIIMGMVMIGLSAYAVKLGRRIGGAAP